MAKTIGGTIKFFLKFGFWTLLILGLLGIGVFVYFAKDLPDPAAVVAQEPAQGTKIFARDGKTLLYEVSGGERRRVVPLEQVAPVMVQATVAAEDQRFYQHFGIDPFAILRAAWQNLQTGGKGPGGSTITQQFVKNAILSGDRTLTRKVKEIILSLELERRYRKDQILEFYLNTISYGSGAYGVEAAAQTFFAKNASELNLPEAATLAALPKAPSRLSPYGSNLDELKQRRNYILDRMTEEGFITNQQASAAKQAELVFERKPTDIKAPHFVFYVQELLEDKYGKDVLQNQGLQVITTLDWELQKKAQEMVSDWVDSIKNRFFASNGALVALDPATGQILTMVGSADFWDFENDGQVNVTIRPRQPGSAFKPFVYATAFKQGYQPETIIFDLPTTFPGGRGQPDYKPQNYTQTFQGPLSIRQALARSVNLVAVKTLYLVGLDQALETARQMGITTLGDRSRYGLSLVLGSGEVKLLELTGAYSAFARDGIQYPVTPFLKITAPNGEILQEFNSQPTRVLEPQIARQINDILSDNQARAALFGLNSPLYFPDRPVAVKTGTTDNFKDAWTIGYSPNLAVGAWVGNNDGSPMRKAAGGYAVAPLWHNFFAFAAEKLNLPPEKFIPPEVKKVDKPMINGEFANRKIVEIDRVTGKLATPDTPPQLVKEVAFKEVHNILHYVKRGDPLGPIPKASERDPQYEAWEKPVRQWLKNQPDSAGFNQEPPTEYDDVHLPQNQPEIKIISPNPGVNIKKTASIIFQAAVSGKFPIKQVDFYAGQELVGSDFQAPFVVSFSPADLKEFQNSTSTPQRLNLRAKVFDEVLNTNQASLELNVIESE